MGLQTDVIRAVAGVAVSTTYLTGAIARIGEPSVRRPAVASQSERRLLVVLSMVLIAYVGGAALGASRLGDGRTGLLLPVALVAGLFAVARARPWSRHSANPRCSTRPITASVESNTMSSRSRLGIVRRTTRCVTSAAVPRASLMA